MWPMAQSSDPHVVTLVTLWDGGGPAKPSENFFGGFGGETEMVGQGLTCGVGFAVLCDGKGTKDEFRPNSDQSQWWGRRDAQVCVRNVM